MQYSKLLVVGISAALLSACSTSQPPAIHGNAAAVNDLAQERINAQEQQLGILNYQVKKLLEQQSPTPISVAPELYQIYFPFNDAKLPVFPQLRYDILPLAKQAKRINLLGRTDGYQPSKADRDIALNRALNLRNYLVDNGVSPTVIYVNYASATDFVDNNWSESGRANNRRVEIEIFPLATN